MSWLADIFRGLFVIAASLLAASLVTSVIFLSIDRYFVRKLEFLVSVVALKKGSKNE